MSVDFNKNYFHGDEIDIENICAFYFQFPDTFVTRYIYIEVGVTNWFLST